MAAPSLEVDCESERLTDVCTKNGGDAEFDSNQVERAKVISVKTADLNWQSRFEDELLQNSKMRTLVNSQNSRLESLEQKLDTVLEVMIACVEKGQQQDTKLDLLRDIMIQFSETHGHSKAATDNRDEPQPRINVQHQNNIRNLWRPEPVDLNARLMKTLIFRRTDLKHHQAQSKPSDPSSPSTSMSQTIKPLSSDGKERKFMFCNYRKKDEDKWKQSILSLGGTVSDDHAKFDETCTHLVVDLPFLATTNSKMAFFGSILMGKWILSHDFIKQSFVNGHFVDEELYEWGNQSGLAAIDDLTGDEKQLAAIARKSRQLRTSDPNLKLPFEGKRFFVIEDIKFPTFSTIFKIGGAEVVTIDANLSFKEILKVFDLERSRVIYMDKNSFNSIAAATTVRSKLEAEQFTCHDPQMFLTTFI